MYIVTSSIDWCEDNFKHSEYVAEYFNTISSFSMVITGLFIYNKCKVSSILLILVGIGSILFHAILSKSTQLLDEVPMIWLALYLVYSGLNLLSNSFTNFFNPCFSFSDMLILTTMIIGKTIWKRSHAPIMVTCFIIF